MPRLTRPTALVLIALARGLRHGFDVLDATGLESGTVYPILRRLEDAGLVRSHWEPVAASTIGQRGRRSAGCGPAPCPRRPSSRPIGRNHVIGYG